MGIPHPKPVIAAAMTVIALLFACPTFADSDDAIAARAKQALVEAQLRDAADIAVTSFNGEVDLDGVVHSEQARQDAARLMGGLPGITAVRNDLDVRERVGQPDSDDVISRRVRLALMAAGVPDALNMKIETFNGEVDLGGVVDSEATRATAAQVAGEVRGVAAVRNGLVVHRP
jgi:hyperosmotically inducible periplasmic protein